MSKGGETVTENNIGEIVKLAFLLNITDSISFCARRAIYQADRWSNEGPVEHMLYLVFKPG